MQKTPELRRRIRQTVQKFNEATVEDVVTELSRREEISEGDVIETLDQLERHGFIYIVPKDSGAKEVRLT